MSTLMERLGRAGARYLDPLAVIDWQRADPALPWLPPHLLSLAALPVQASMTRPEMLRFSRVEFARLCAAGLWLEGLLISRVTATGFPAARAGETRVMLQEVREECGHGLMFLEMIERAGMRDVPLLGATGLLTRVARHLDAGGAAFWAMALIGESVTDAFAMRALRESGDGGICPVARQVLALHHRDEARHIAAARAFIETRVTRMGRARRMAFGAMVHLLLQRFLHATLYPTRQSLAALGMTDAAAIARAARRCPSRRRLARSCAAHALDLLGRGPLGAALPRPAREGGGA